MIVKSDNIDEITALLETELSQYGFEFHPFKVSWYNSLVEQAFRLAVDEESVAFLVISTPKMFEKAFMPFLKDKEDHLSDLMDPIDECMQFYMAGVPKLLPKYKVDIVHDFELHPNRRPKIIMQCAAHASGAAYLYHPSQMNILGERDEKMYGVCIHPKYAGWFALRAVIFLEDLLCPDLNKRLPIDVLPTRKEKLKLLELYNNNWQDWEYRDVIPADEKYSPLQMKYFETPPGERQAIVKELCEYVLPTPCPPFR